MILPVGSQTIGCSTFWFWIEYTTPTPRLPIVRWFTEGESRASPGSPVMVERELTSHSVNQSHMPALFQVLCSVLEIQRTMTGTYPDDAHR